MTDEQETRALLRRLTGKLSPEDRRRLEARLDTEPALRAAAERLQRDWDALTLPDAVAPPGFADGVMARISVADPEAPAWARLAAAAALVAGVALGVGLGRLTPVETLQEELDRG